MKKGLIIVLGMLCVWQLQGQVPMFVPTNNLEGYYSFSGNVLDQSGNGNNSSNYTVISTTDRFSEPLRALYFSGTNTEFLNYGDVDGYEPYIATYSFWMYPAEYGGSAGNQQKPILTKWGAAGDAGNSSFRIYMDGTNLCLLLSDGITTDTLTTPLSGIALNTWTHVVITANYGFIDFYINSDLVTSTTSPISSFNNSVNEFKVGGWFQDSDPSYSSFTGKIDDLGIWSRALDACEVIALYEGVACGTTGIANHTIPEKKLIGMYDVLGRETAFQPGVPLIYLYSDGTRERRVLLTP